MTIKEVEKAVGMTSANIRFYEKEELIFPTRNEENNYRDYTRQDIERLEKIKLLRALGITIPDIRTLIDQPAKLADVMKQRIEQIDAEKKQLDEIEEICRYIVRQDMDFNSLDVSILDEKAELLKEKLKYIMNADTTEEIISRKSLNNIITGMLVYSFLFNAAVCFWGYRYFQENPWEWIFHAFAFVTFGSGIMIYMSSKPIVQFISFQTVTCILSPFLLEWMSMATDGESYHTPIGIFFLMSALFVLLIGKIACRNERYILKYRYMFSFGVCYSLMECFIFYLLYGKNLIAAIMCMVITLYISMSWSVVNTSTKDYNKYYAMISAVKILNIAAFLMTTQGWYGNKNWRRDGRKFK